MRLSSFSNRPTIQLDNNRQYRKQNLLVVFVISLLTVASYSSFWDNGFVTWDTSGYLLQNDHVKAITFDNIRWMLTSYFMSNWHPVTWLTHAIDYQLYGLNPGGHISTNLLLHVLNACILFFIARLLLEIAGNRKPVLAAAICAILFAVHPQHVEPVIWVAQRKEVLCALFFLSTIWFYLQYIQAEEGKRGKWYVASCITAMLAIMSKPMAVTLPLVLLLLDTYPFNRIEEIKTAGNSYNVKNIFGILIEKLPFILLSIFIATIAFTAQYTGGSVASVEKIGLMERIFNSVNNIYLYLSKWVFPLNLSPFYDYPDFKSGEFSFVRVLQILVLMSLLFVLTVYWRKGQRHWMVAFVYYFVTLLPVIGIVQIGNQGAADRYTYIPLLPFYIFAGVVIARVNSQNENRIAKLGVAVFTLVLVGLLGFLTHKQVNLWDNDFVFWSYTVQQSPRSGLVRANYGRVLYEVGLLEDAEKQLTIANSLRNSSLIYSWLGDVYYRESRWLQAEESYLKSINEKQDNRYVHQDVLFKQMALISFKMKKYQDAKKYAEQAIKYPANKTEMERLLQSIDQIDSQSSVLPGR